MSNVGFKTRLEDLPEVIPVFPLTGVLLLPTGMLPLNIFEPRYLAMVDAALKGNRLIGMVQPSLCSGGNTISQDAVGDICKTGCVGRITSFQETEDGRYLITLTGVCRFEVVEELPQQDGYRVARADWNSFGCDIKLADCLNVNRDRLNALLREYFDKEGMTCDWTSIERTHDQKLMTALAMVCPFSPQEKQALLETVDCKQRAEKFLTLLEMAAKEGGLKEPLENMRCCH